MSDQWRVWTTAENLEKNGIKSPLQNREICKEIIKKVVSILREWGSQWSKTDNMQGFLNKSSLQHEVEESIVTITLLMEWMGNQSMDRYMSTSESVSNTSLKILSYPNSPEQRSMTVVDVCCGKGIFSMILSYLFQDDNRISKIVMLDRAKIDWNHIKVANESALLEKRPLIDTWEGCNLFDHDDLIQRLESLPSPLAMIGIHLCKNLSPTCVGLVNTLGNTKCPFLCLAPCCLPRKAICRHRKSNYSGVIKVRAYESLEEKKIRMDATRKREGASGKLLKNKCYVCDEYGHPSLACVMIPKDNEEVRIAMLQQAARKTPCWRCGEVGHFKADCTSSQTSCRPVSILPASIEVNVSDVLYADEPFHHYCHLLKTSIQREEVILVDTHLSNDSIQHKQEGNWNGQRKSIYIVASS
mmetsp:Transcript_6236/g.9052  ORF Transcript_6236/g.9052 Transcript_6236/m.9052 type:complete len:414 (+) Transcript_6236:14-1255(+)